MPFSGDSPIQWICTGIEVMVQSTRGRRWGAEVIVLAISSCQSLALKATIWECSDMPRLPIQIKTFLFPCWRYMGTMKKLPSKISSVMTTHLFHLTTFNEQSFWSGIVHGARYSRTNGIQLLLSRNAKSEIMTILIGRKIGLTGG